jgi:ADP-heptose:LPS heptosyltransferase
LKILANVFLKDPSVEGIALTPGSETGKKVSLYLAGLINKYSEYQSRLSFWAVGKTAPVSYERLKAKGNENYGMQPCPEGAINLINSLSILETAYLLSLCKFVITMDSGLLHLALSTDINIIAMFTVIDPQFRKAWRHGSFDYKLQVIPPNGDCYYCSNLKQDIIKKGQSYTQCPLGLSVQCLPTVEAVYKSLNPDYS